MGSGQTRLAKRNFESRKRAKTGDEERRGEGVGNV